VHTQRAPSVTQDGCQVHVPHGDLHALVPGQLLDRLRRRSSHGEVRAEGVAEGVGTDATEPGLPADPVEAELDCVAGSGLSLQSLTPSLAESLGLPSGTRGAAIADVTPDSPSERAGLQAGEVIVEVDRKRIESADEAISALRGDGNHLLRVRGAAGTRFVTYGAAEGRAARGTARSFSSLLTGDRQ
jgi:membrane-associated protease RseP (regulator of RpoE activity)